MEEKTFEEQFPSYLQEIVRGSKLNRNNITTELVADAMTKTCLDKQKVRDLLKKMGEDSHKLEVPFRDGGVIRMTLCHINKELGL